MIIEAQDCKFIVQFRHFKQLAHVHIGDLCFEEESKIHTQCRIFIYEKGKKTDEMTYLGLGIATCSPGDNFCKAVGRKLALTRALNTINTEVPLVAYKNNPRFNDKDFRKEFWKSYFSQVRNTVSSRKIIKV